MILQALKKKNYWNRFKRIPVYTKKTWMALGISQRASAAFYSPLKSLCISVGVNGGKGKTKHQKIKN